MNLKINKNRGFTIYEILIAIAIIGALSPFVYSAIRDLMQKRTAMEYADYSNTYANKFIEYIESNYGDYYTYAQNNPTKTQIIPFSKIKNSMHGTLNWGVIPCVAIRYESSSKDIQAIMFYTDNTKVDHRKINRQLGIKAMNEFGSGSAYYDNGVVNGINGTWALARGNSFMNLVNIISCDTSTLTANGLVINLNMMANFPHVIPKSSSAGSKYLSRIRDDKNKFGESSNENTMQTDIIMQNSDGFNGIFVSGNSNSKVADKPVYLGVPNSDKTSKFYKKLYGNVDVPYLNHDGVVVVGGGIQTETLKINHSASAYSTCSKAEVGTIVKEIPDGSLMRQASYLICGYHMARCGSYCFVPIENSIHYTFDVSQEKEDFTCPSGMLVEPSSVRIGQKILKYPLPSENSSCITFDKMNGPSISVADACIASYSDPMAYYLDPRSGGNSIDDTGTYSYSAKVIVRDISPRVYKPNPARDPNIAHCNCDNQRPPVSQSYLTVLTGVTCSVSPTLEFKAR